MKRPFSFLSQLISASATELPIDSAADFVSSGVAIVGAECVAYTYKDATNLMGCTRGYDGTTAVAHPIGACVTGSSSTTYSDSEKDVAFVAGNFTASGSMTWTVEEAEQILFRYRMLTQTLMYITLSIEGADVAGTPSTDFIILIPLSKSISKETNSIGVVWDDGTAVSVRVYTKTEDPTHIYVSKIPAANFSASAGTNAMMFTLFIEVS
jgi:hypothetical protein